VFEVNLRFDIGTANGIIFQFEPNYPLAAASINWIGEAIGELSLAETSFFGIILASPSSLRSEWLPEIHGLSFENPFGPVLAGKKVSSELLELIAMVSRKCRQATHQDVLKLKIARNLRWLSLARADIGDESLSALESLYHLHSIDVSSTRISDVGIEILSQHIGLRELGLNSTAITSAALDVVAANLVNLESLSIKDTQVTAQSIQNLRQALPRCQVIW